MVGVHNGKGKLLAGWGSQGKASGKQRRVEPQHQEGSGTRGPSGPSFRALRVVMRGSPPFPLCFGKMRPDSLLSFCPLPVDVVLAMLLLSGFPVGKLHVLSSGSFPRPFCDWELKWVGQSATMPGMIFGGEQRSGP